MMLWWSWLVATIGCIPLISPGGGGVTAFSLLVPLQGLSREKIWNLARTRFNISQNIDHDANQDHFHKPMTGRVAVVTGAAGGIGSQVGKLLHSLGATVVAMDRVGHQELLEALIASDDDDNRWVPFPLTDHGNLTCVAQVANQIQRQFPTIDLLVNCAGLAYPQDNNPQRNSLQPLVSAHGRDLAFTVNYLSHVLLTEKLLPNLSRALGRIVHVTSTFHWKVDGSELLPPPPSDSDNDYDASNHEDIDQRNLPLAVRSTHQSAKHVERSYANTKLAQLWYSRSVRRHCPNAHVSSVCACPTWAATGIAGEAGRDFLQRFAFSIMIDNNDSCGPGITSTINAMLRTDEELADALDGPCFVANSRTVEYLTSWAGMETWLTSNLTTNLLKIRDDLTDVLAIVLLIFQRFTYDEFILQKTSPESYRDQDKMDQFYHWSRASVQPWL
mmetsp:Transcript_27220/g.75091  ORF Transcript_27220/g.75091 Transcript_27220/m.75091 type:complete len:444 (-) Transcript_27220:138-1469(-)